MMINKISYYQKAFAKLFDYAFCFLTIAFATLLTPFASDEVVYFYLLLATPFLWILPEAILLKTLGKTPGCSLFGISFRKEKGGNLSWSEALRISLYFDKNLGVQWVLCEKSLSRFIIRLGIGCSIILAAVFGKAVLEFPQEFGREITKKGWVRYTSSENDFAADFPSKPKVEQKQLEISQANRTIDYQEVTSNYSKVSYSVSSLELPKKWCIFGASTILKGAMTVLLDNMPSGSKLVSKEITKHGSHSAMNFHIREGSTDIKGRLILVGRKLFKVEFIQDVDKQAEDIGLAFIDSFKPLTSS